ncbi:MAG: hypothetical protein GY816_14095 [Cytophagales bacterium]|nr:hypothetical protein [Cytophagales bacterium]
MQQVLCFMTTLVFTYEQMNHPERGPHPGGSEELPGAPLRVQMELERIGIRLKKREEEEKKKNEQDEEKKKNEERMEERKENGAKQHSGYSKK